jgi:hypothetical protein
VAVSRESISELAAESPAIKSDHGARQEPGVKPCGPPASHGVGASSGQPYRAQRNLPQLLDDTEAWQRRDSSRVS